MALVRAGAELTPTDKAYKVYVNSNAKFYFLHLSEPQMIEFVQLYNDKKFPLAYPGHFYVMPFFMKAAAPNPAPAGS